MLDEWIQYQNWYNEVNEQDGDDLTNHEMGQFQDSTTYWWRVRYRDRSLGWSAWSVPARFHTSGSGSTDNLIENPGAEDAVAGWIVDEGAMESLSAGECNGISPFQGDKYFAVGALCDEYPFASAHQDIDVSMYSAIIDSSDGVVLFGAHLSDWNGSDQPALAVHCLDAMGMVLSTSDTFALQVSTWTSVDETIAIPIDTRTIRYIVMGTRFGGTDNDSYFDEIYCRISDGIDSCSAYVAPGPSNGRLYVDKDATGVPTGESWQKAYLRCENALVAASADTSVNEIWIADGVYYPTSSTDRNASFDIPGGLSVYGGFKGDEFALSERDILTNQVVLSGDIGAPGDSTDNTYHVVAISEIEDSVLIDGIEITSGMAVDADDPRGGAVNIDSTNMASIIIRNCNISSSVAAQGGGLFNNAQAIVDSCLFQFNSSTSFRQRNFKWELGNFDS